MQNLATPSHYKWNDIPSEKLDEYVMQRIVPGDNMMLSQLTLMKDALVHKHAHPDEQFIYILKGALLFQLGDQLEHQFIVSAGEILHIPANMPHSTFALEDTLNLDIFTAPRSDPVLPDPEN